MHHVEALQHQKGYTTYIVSPKELAEAYAYAPDEIKCCVISNVSPQKVDQQHQLYPPRKLTRAQPTQAMTVYRDHKL